MEERKLVGLETPMKEEKPNLVNEIEKSPQERNIDFQMFKAEQRKFIKEKLQIQKKIEGMEREYQFISKLDNDEVAYIMQKKREAAALTIQRVFRRKQDERQLRLEAQMKAQYGIAHDLLDPEVQQVVEQRKAELAKRRKAVEQELKDDFYGKIQPDREKELVDEVVRRRKIKSVEDFKRYDLEKLREKYERLYEEFCGEYGVAEAQRLKTLAEMRELQVMMEYLVTKEELDPNKPFDFKSLPVWSYMADNFTAEDLKRVRDRHHEKLDRYRKRKDWEAWVEEDELDIEGDRILAEIKNYKAEFFFDHMVV